MLLTGRSVLLEQPRKSGSKVISHMLSSHGGEIFLHVLSSSRSILEDPPSISEGCGGRVTDYRITVRLLKNVYFMCGFCLYVCLCTVCMPGSFGGQKRVFCSLELELETVVSHWVGAENLTWALCKSSHWTSVQPWYKPHYLYVCFESFSKSSCCMLRLWGTPVSAELVVVSITDITVSSLPCDAFSDWEVSGS